MANEPKRETFEEAAERLGHRLVREDGDIDIFAYNPSDPHNGPRCELCGEGWCHHCTPASKLKPCPAVRAAEPPQ